MTLPTSQQLEDVEAYLNYKYKKPGRTIDIKPSIFDDRLLQCSTSRQQKVPEWSKIGYYDVDTELVQQLLSEDSLRYDVHMVLQRVIVRSWIRDYSIPIMNGVNGRVEVGRFNDDTRALHLNDAVEKRSINHPLFSERSTPSLEHEAVVGSYINYLRLICPTFVHTYDYDDNSDRLYLEYVKNSTSLTEMLKKRMLDIDNLDNIIIQVLLALYVADSVARHDVQSNQLAQRGRFTIDSRIRPGYTHYDLHTSNILIQDLKTPTHIRIGENVVEVRYLARIIDQGTAFITGVRGGIGSNRYLRAGAYCDTSNPIADIWLLFESIIDRIERVNDEHLLPWVVHARRRMNELTLAEPTNRRPDYIRYYVQQPLTYADAIDSIYHLDAINPGIGWKELRLQAQAIQVPGLITESDYDEDTDLEYEILDGLM